MKSFIINYLNSYPHEKIVSDVNHSYEVEDFKKKIFFYKAQIKSLLKKGDIKGVAIDLDRSCEYICIIFACWLNDCFYLPLSNYLSKKNKNYQIKKSLVSIIVSKTTISFLKIKKFDKNELIKKNNKKISYIIFTSGSTGQKKVWYF